MTIINNISDAVWDEECTTTNSSDISTLTVNNATTSNNNIQQGVATNQTIGSGYFYIPTSGNTTWGSSMSAPRRMYCDRKKHRLYRAIRETCPCFKDIPFIWNVPVDGDEGMFDHNGISYFINAKGLVRRVTGLFERLEVQEELIDELRKEVARLREAKV